MSSFVDRKGERHVRIRTLSIVLFFAAAVCSARADVILRGDGTAMGKTGSPCSAGGTGYGSLSIACSSSDQTASMSVTGNGGPYVGGITVNALVYGSDAPYGQAFASGELDLSETYILVGGLGPATVNVYLQSTGMDLNSGPVSCTLAIDGVSELCDPAGVTESFPVEFWVPFSISLDADASGGAWAGVDEYENFSYSISGPGLFALPTPEPSSGLLLLPGLAGVFFAARLRARRLVERS